MPKIEKEKGFRAQYSTFGLTYSKCPCTKAEVMEFLLNKIEIEDYYMVQETHDPLKAGYDAARPNHLHVWFKTMSKPNIQSNRFFDYKGYHPNIGKKARNWVYNYLQKQDKDPLTNIPANYIGLAQAGDYSGALKNFQFMHPKEYVMCSDRIESTLRRLSKPKKQGKIYDLKTDFVIPDYDWETKCLFMHGPSRIGKSQYVKSYITHVLKKTFFRITSHDGWKHYAGQDFIIVDDCNLRDVGRETAIHMCEIDDEADISCRYADAHIPAGIPKIFLSNDPPGSYFPDDKYGAIFPGRVFIFSASSIRFY